MDQSDQERVAAYLAAVRRGLRGLPPADVDDTVAELRAHLLEEAGERGDVETALADFGDAAEVASEIVERRLRPEERCAVPVASLGRRYSAWATDVVIGFGPMLLVPTAITFLALVGGSLGATPVWIQISEQVAYWWLRALGYVGLARPQVVSPWQWLLAVGLVAWAAFYWLWLRRATSRSVGMWMAGLTGIRLKDDRVVVRARDIAEHPAPLGSDRARWWVLLAAIPAGCLCILLLLYYMWMCIGPFLPPRILG
jgi:hypothetical protein